MKYIHLTTELRCQINTLLSIGMAQKTIAFYIGVSASTISRELKRNSGLRGYRSQPADLKAASRRSLASRRPRRMTAAMIHIVESKLIEKWSPEQIAGVLRSNGIKISYETIYRHIWADKRAGGTLYTHLRRKGKKYNHRGAKNAGRGCIPNRVDITSRPKTIDRKGRIGDWKGDTIIGAKMQGAILSFVDRKSKYILLAAMEGKFAEQAPELVLRCLERLPKKRKGYLITFDNDKEFSKHEIITKKTGLLCYAIQIMGTGFKRAYHWISTTVFSKKLKSKSLFSE